MYQVTSDHEILDAAATQARLAVESTKEDDPDRARHLTNLLSILNCQAEQNDDGRSCGRPCLSDGLPFRRCRMGRRRGQTVSVAAA